MDIVMTVATVVLISLMLVKIVHLFLCGQNGTATFATLCLVLFGVVMLYG